jgi:hypothetical protein
MNLVRRTALPVGTLLSLVLAEMLARNRELTRSDGEDRRS